VRADFAVGAKGAWWLLAGAMRLFGDLFSFLLTSSPASSPFCAAAISTSATRSKSKRSEPTADLSRVDVKNGRDEQS